jgi:valyl-tRNA synthetase
VRAFLAEHVDAIRLLVKTKGAPAIAAPGGPRDPGTTVSVVPSTHGPIEVLVQLKGLVDQAHEIARIDREKKKIEKDVAVIDKKLGSPGFVDRAPREVVEETKAQREALVAALQRLAEARSLAAEL